MLSVSDIIKGRQYTEGVAAWNSCFIHLFQSNSQGQVELGWA